MYKTVKQAIIRSFTDHTIRHGIIWSWERNEVIQNMWQDIQCFTASKIGDQNNLLRTCPKDREKYVNACCLKVLPNYPALLRPFGQWECYDLEWYASEHNHTFSRSFGYVRGTGGMIVHLVYRASCMVLNVTVNSDRESSCKHIVYLALWVILYMPPEIYREEILAIIWQLPSKYRWIAKQGSN